MQLPISQYSELLQKKTEKLTALLQPFNAPEIAVFDSPTSHYRMRAEFRIWHDKGDFLSQLCLIKAPCSAIEWMNSQLPAN